MPIKRVRAIGCSWTYGDELPESIRLSNSWPGLVANHYGLELDNCGYPGASLESMRYVLHWHLKYKDDADETLYMVGLTNSERRSWYNAVSNSAYTFNFNNPYRDWNQHVHSIWLKGERHKDIDPAWYDIDKLWIANSSDAGWAEQNHWETVTVFSTLPHVIIFNCLPSFKIFEK